MSPASSALPTPPTHTKRYTQPRIGDIEVNAYAIFAADSTEPRGHLPLWQEMAQARASQCITITRQEQDQIEVTAGGSAAEWISLRDEQRLRALVEPANGNVPLYLDISGLGHHVWAPVFRAALNRRDLRIVYAEPLSYRPHPSPASPTMFDLSTDMGGIAPIPGMARLTGRVDESKSLLIAFLGFEGNRAQHVALSLDSVPKVIPVIGVPGFRLEYPAFAVACNRGFLNEYQCHAEIRLARASCPFEAYEVLSQLRRDYADYHFYIAPLGTKPHSLGAIHYAIKHSDFTEVVYDHPVRKAGRTKGVGPVHVYGMT
jgi:hypothetical protein